MHALLVPCLGVIGLLGLGHSTTLLSNKCDDSKNGALVHILELFDVEVKHKISEPGRMEWIEEQQERWFDPFTTPAELDAFISLFLFDNVFVYVYVYMCLFVYVFVFL